MNVLLVEDDVLLGQAIETALARWNHTSVWVRNGAAALSAARAGGFDLIVLDLGLPRVQGLEVLKSLRTEACVVPVLIITARDGLTDRVRGLDAGADDYLNKPFHLDELAARMRALHRRALGQSQNLILVGSLCLDPLSAQATYKGQTVELSRGEFVLLRALAERAGRAVSREALMQALYGADRGAESNTLEVHIHVLRRKLSPMAIRTVRGLGYLFVKDGPSA
jgi:two-component system, OmpR family, response regulator QseB